MPAFTEPPTLEQLAALLAAVSEARATREPGGTRTHFVFSVDNEALSAIGGAFYANGPGILAALQEALGRLVYFDGVTKDFAGVDQKGTTAADCAAFIANELKHVPPTHDLQSNLRRRMFNATLQKLNELGTWRAAADAKRFQAQREAERKRQEEWKKAHEEAKRQKKEDEREKARRERDSTFHFYEDQFESYFSDALRNAWRGYQANWEEEAFRNAFEGTYSNREEPKTKARNKDRAPWFEVLGVPVNANKATIKAAWRRKVKDLHPDKPENRTPENEQRIRDVNTAKDEGLRGLA